MVQNIIQRLCKLPKKNSVFLFGPRGTGKTTLLHQILPKKSTLFIDLLNPRVFEEFLNNPSRLESFINTSQNRHKSVVIDEIQKLPHLLDVIHTQIQKTKRQFILTGSSSRRLKQRGTNLLAGRAWVYHLYPFTSIELGSRFQLRKVLEWGSLPEAILPASLQARKEYLNAYVGTYLEKEIQHEGWVRKLQPFRRFLSLAAQMNGRIINKSKIARDVGVDDVTVSSYFEILEDTLLGFLLPAFHRSVRKSQRMAPKFYFIDLGIKRALLKTLTVPLLPQTFAFGEAFEHWVILEIMKLASYHRKDWSYSYLRTKEGVEIDLIIQRPRDMVLVEIKSATHIREEDAKSLQTLGRDLDKKAKKWLISCDPLEQTFEHSVKAMHYKTALKKLFK